jgi:hypothetical protein
MDMALVAAGHFVKYIQITPIVHFGKEAGFAVVAALYHVLGNSGNSNTGVTRHLYLLARLAKI